MPANLWTRAATAEFLPVVQALPRTLGAGLFRRPPLASPKHPRSCSRAPSEPRHGLGAAGSGASGSSTIKARLFVPSDMPAQLSGGEMSSPSQVYLLGMGWPCSKAGDVSVRAINPASSGLVVFSQWQGHGAGKSLDQQRGMVVGTAAACGHGFSRPDGCGGFFWLKPQKQPKTCVARFRNLVFLQPGKPPNRYRQPPLQRPP